MTTKLCVRACLTAVGVSLAAACKATEGPYDASATPTPSSAPAQPPNISETRFTFTVSEWRLGAEQATYNENPQTFVNVALPKEMGWACHRIPRVLADERLRSGFECSNDSWRSFVSVLVGCKKSEDDPLHTSAMRLFAPSALRDPSDGTPRPCTTPPCAPRAYDLVASCETVGAGTARNPYR